MSHIFAFLNGDPRNAWHWLHAKLLHGLSALLFASALLAAHGRSFFCSETERSANGAFASRWVLQSSKLPTSILFELGNVVVAADFRVLTLVDFLLTARQLIRSVS